MPPSPLEIISQLATIAGVLGLLGALFSWRQSRDTFHQGVIVSCTTRFQKLSPKLQVDDLSAKTIMQYLELCNEELFYFEKKYLPQAIIDEWVEGMVGLIGLWCNNELLPSTSQAPAEVHKTASRLYQAAVGYPRLCHAFTIKPEAKRRIEQAGNDALAYKQGQAKADVMRAQMVLEVLANLRQYQQLPFYTYLRLRRDTLLNEQY